jgi:hypothetical protein
MGFKGRPGPRHPAAEQRPSAASRRLDARPCSFCTGLFCESPPRGGKMALRLALLSRVDAEQPPPRAVSTPWGGSRLPAFGFSSVRGGGGAPRTLSHKPRKKPVRQSVAGSHMPTAPQSSDFVGGRRQSGAILVVGPHRGGRQPFSVDLRDSVPGRRRPPLRNEDRRLFSGQPRRGAKRVWARLGRLGHAGGPPWT